MYLDPGAWSMALQVLIGAAIAIPTLIGIFWGRIRAHLPGRGRKGEESD